MTQNHRQPDNHEDFDLPESLIHDLRTAMGPLDTVPGEADDRILAMGRRNLGRHRRLRLVASVATLSAAAAAIVLILLLPNMTPTPQPADTPGAKRTQTSPLADTSGGRQSEPATGVAGQRPMAGSPSQPEDSAGAKRTQTPGDVAQLPATPEDIDASGRVDILDALALARHLDRDATFQPDWDINADGQLDQHDIDAIAQRAVKLNLNGEATP